MTGFFRNNGLSLAFLLLFAGSMAGQFYTGYTQYLEELEQLGLPSVTPGQYPFSGHFIQSTFENWESEFLQMALFVVFTIFLQQKGSSESKDFDKDEEVDREPDPNRKNAPWPVKKGGVALALYKRSLTLALLLLFLLSFCLHLYGSYKDECQQRAVRQEPSESIGKYLGNGRFWFESFQNWESEFLSVLVLVVFSIYLRQKGSPQSKPVDAPDEETGE